MRFVIIALALIFTAPAAASLVGSGLVPHSAMDGFARFALSLPDAATAGLMFAGLGLVAGAQRGRSRSVAD